MLKNYMPCKLPKFPSRIGTFAINEDIKANESHSLFYKSYHLVVKYSAPIKASYTGKFCQRVYYWLNIKGRSCYGMIPKSSSLVFHCMINIELL